MIQGKIITLRAAKVEERKLIFDMGMKTNILTYSRSYKRNLEDFLNDYNERYFGDRNSSVCGSMMICLNKISVGFISYSLIDCGGKRINPLIMELDIWLDGEECCGKGIGSDAVFTLSDYLHLKYNIHTFIMCPSKTNTRAIRAYEKAGFILVTSDEKQTILQSITCDDICSLKADSEYLSDEYAFMLKVYIPAK